jgi:hypothetical protein
MEILMELILGMLAVFSVDNAEFFNTAGEQQDQGYVWEYVGKQEASGTSAILIDDKFIYYRLTKND